jgi:hypothetical protein
MSGIRYEWRFSRPVRTHERIDGGVIDPFEGVRDRFRADQPATPLPVGERLGGFVRAFDGGTMIRLRQPDVRGLG